MYKISIFILVLLIHLESVAQTDFNTKNQTFDTTFRTIKIHPLGTTPEAQIQSEIANIHHQNLILTFDKLGDDVGNYAVKIYNCRADWTISDLNANEYLDEYNEFYITEFESSFNTKINFIHFRFPIPTLKMAGNYVLKVYENGYEDEVIFIKRFCIYAPLMGTGGQSERLTGGSISVHNQEITFSVNYANLDVLNPEEQIKVTIRQNGRWDKSIENLKPTFIKVAQKVLDYNYFNTENVFRGGNEFRMFDLTSLRQNTLNVRQVIWGNTKNSAILMPEKSRQGKVRHDIFDDMNGRYYVQNQDNAQDSHTESDYVEVNFSLQSPQVSGRVLVMGEFTNWELNPRYELIYNALQGSYQATFRLKQGYYNYIYALVSSDYYTADEEYFEGSHFNTENDYEIFVYFRPLGARTDILAGYKKIK